jgi:ankyrin repeat protein
MPDMDNLNQLIAAAEVGDDREVKALLDSDLSMDIDGGDRCESTALHHASNKGHLSVVKLLVEKGAIINATNMWEKTSLHNSANNGHLDVVQYLVENGARMEATSNKKRLTPLHLAAQYDHFDVVKYLVEQGADVSAQSEDGKTPYELASKEEIKVLLRSAGEPSARERSNSDRQGRARRNSEAIDADVEQQQRNLASVNAEYERVQRLNDTVKVYIYEHIHMFMYIYVYTYVYLYTGRRRFIYMC